MMQWLLYGFVVVAGALNAVQAGCNSSLNKVIEQPIAAALMILAVAFSGVFTLGIISRVEGGQGPAKRMARERYPHRSGGRSHRLPTHPDHPVRVIREIVTGHFALWIGPFDQWTASPASTQWRTTLASGAKSQR
jgi:hypothetical protein